MRPFTLCLTIPLLTLFGCPDHVPARIVAALYRARSQGWVGLFLRQLRLMRSALHWINLTCMLLFLELFRGMIAVAQGQAVALDNARIFGLVGGMTLVFVVWMAAAAWAAYDQFIRVNPAATPGSAVDTPPAGCSRPGRSRCDRPA